MPKIFSEVRLDSSSRDGFSHRFNVSMFGSFAKLLLCLATQTRGSGGHEKEEMAILIKDIFQDHRGVYGTRRLQQALKRKEMQVSRRRIGRLMKEQGLFCKTKRAFKATTDPHHSLPIADNLLERRFQVRLLINIMSAILPILKPKKAGFIWQ